MTYQYYYRRGKRYYFRNDKTKISFLSSEPLKIKFGSKVNIDIE